MNEPYDTGRSLSRDQGMLGAIVTGGWQKMAEILFSDFR